jgi:hypothetical protein
MWNSISWDCKSIPEIFQPTFIHFSLHDYFYSRAKEIQECRRRLQAYSAQVPNISLMAIMFDPFIPCLLPYPQLQVWVIRVTYKYFTVRCTLSHCISNRYRCVFHFSWKSIWRQFGGECTSRRNSWRNGSASHNLYSGVGRAWITSAKLT